MLEERGCQDKAIALPQELHKLEYMRPMKTVWHDDRCLIEPAFGTFSKAGMHLLGDSCLEIRVHGHWREDGYMRFSLPHDVTPKDVRKEVEKMYFFVKSIQED